MNKKELSNGAKLFVWSMLYAIIIVAVFFILKFLITDKTAALKADNVRLGEEYDVLQMYITNEAHYRSLTEECNTQSLQILNSYVSDITKRGTIRKFEEQLEKYNFKTASISLGENEELLEVLIEDKDYYGIFTKTSVSYNTNYENFKKYIRDLTTLNLNMSIDSFSISEDKNLGSISGTLTLYEYAVKGSDRLYIEPDINIHVGEDSIFTSIEGLDKKEDTKIDLEVPDEPIEEDIMDFEEIVGD